MFVVGEAARDGVEQPFLWGADACRSTRRERASRAWAPDPRSSAWPRRWWPRPGARRDNFGVDAGYTYFGQFVDHDVTLDTSAPRVEPLAAAGPRLASTASGRGPGRRCTGHGPEPLHGARLRTRRRPPDESALAREDLPRDDAGRALIGDTRNDENLIIAQLHLLFIRFHNRVVEHVAAPGMPRDPGLPRGARLVRWHYQWLIVNDFLPKLVGDDGGRRRRAPRGAAVRAVDARVRGARRYRFGHSMVREDYKLNDAPDRPAVPRRAGATPDPARTLAGNRRAAGRSCVIDWKHFFRVGDALAAAQQADRRRRSRDRVRRDARACRGPRSRCWTCSRASRTACRRARR